MSLLPHLVDPIAKNSGIASEVMRAWMEDTDDNVLNLLSAYSTISVVNTTTTPLGGSSSFTGTGEQNFSTDVMVSIKTDTDSTAYFEFSNDNINWDTFPTNGFEVAANVHEFHTAVKGPRYFRLRIVNNSSSAQTYLRAYTYYGPFRSPNSPINQAIGRDADSSVVRPTIAQDEISRGLRGGVTQWNKFSYRTTTTAAGGEQTIWATNTNFTVLTSASTFTITYNNATDGASTTGARSLLFYYLDANERLATATHVLGSTGSDVTSFTGLGINRAVVVVSGTATYNTNDITITETTGGTTQAIIPALGSVTQQAIFHLPNNANGSVKWLRMRANRLSGSNPIILFKIYVYNRGTATRYEVFRETLDTGTDTVMDIKDPCNFSLNPRDVIYFVMDTDRDNTIASCRFSLNVYNLV